MKLSDGTLMLKVETGTVYRPNGDILRKTIWRTNGYRYYTKIDGIFVELKQSAGNYYTNH
jgi:hypothetical protein